MVPPGATTTIEEQDQEVSTGQSLSPGPKRIVGDVNIVLEYRASVALLVRTPLYGVTQNGMRTLPQYHP